MDMRDVAKLAGVSSATVSRVINGLPSVKPATAEHVRRVIEQLKFFPNSSATTLKHGRSSTFGLIIPDITNPFFPELIGFFEKVLVENNRDMLLAMSDFHPTRLRHSVRRMLIRKVDGVALLASEIDTEPIEDLIYHRVPIVTMDRRLTAPGVSDILIDNLSGMAQAVKHLKEYRHRKIAYIGGSAGRTISDHRAHAFIKAMKRHGLEVIPEFIRTGNYRVSGGESAMLELLNLKARPTAILTANDMTAIGALKAIHQRGFSVPDDFSLIGFDDIELSEALHPPLTTLRLPRQQLAQLFFSALDDARSDPHAVGQQYSVKTSLVIRQSTGPAGARAPRKG